MDISQSKKTIENLLLKSKANTGVYNANSTLHDFVQPFFESLGWNFKSDVIDYLDDDAADKEFQIDGTVLSVKGKVVKDMVSIQQWGVMFDISEIKLIKYGKKLDKNAL